MVAAKRAFLDTNIFVYQFDRRHPVRQRIAEDLIDGLLSTNRGVISFQVVQEFCNVALKKFDTVLPAYELKIVLQEVLEPLCQPVQSTHYYQRALDLHGHNSLSFYDALILQAALDLNCDVLYSEDFQNKQRFGNLEIINPFV